jgi:hypothetical protein
MQVVVWGTSTRQHWLPDPGDRGAIINRGTWDRVHTILQESPQMRGGRREMQLPEGVAQPRGPNSTLVKVLARAFRRKRMLEFGECATITELAEGEGIAPSFMTGVLRLTLLVPDIAEAILDGRHCLT